MHMPRCLAAVLGALVLLPAGAGAQTAIVTAPPHVHNRTLSTVADGDRRVFRLDQQAGDGVAWWPEPFTTGVIALDLRGRDVAQGSFVGIAFHGVDAQTYEAIYFRPFNFRTDDPARRRRAVQYVSHPAHPWQTLREQQPGVFEQPVTPPPDPNDWFHATVHVTPDTITVFVDPAASAVLEVKRLTTRPGGWVGLWVGNGSPGDFANVRITRATAVASVSNPGPASVTGAAASGSALGRLAGTYVGRIVPEQGDAVDVRFVIAERDGVVQISAGPRDQDAIAARDVVRTGDALTFTIDAPGDSPNTLAFDVTVTDGAIAGAVVQTREGQVRKGRLTLTRQP
jgi:hypothetical protein